MIKNISDNYIKYKKNVFVKLGLKKHRTAIIGYISLRKDLKQKELNIGKNAILLSNSIIYMGSKIGDNLILGHNAIIREENIIGDNFKLWPNSIVDYGCRIGNNVKIHSNVYIAQFTEIEDDVFIGPGTIVINDIHPGCKFSKKCMKGPLIKRGVNIGANVTINPFITIGENSLVGSGSVVTKDIPKNCLAYGIPAKMKKKITDIKCIRGITDSPYII